MEDLSKGDKELDAVRELAALETKILESGVRNQAAQKKYQEALRDLQRLAVGESE